jgi:hypothetical protein
MGRYHFFGDITLLFTVLERGQSVAMHANIGIFGVRCEKMA